jgi:hypothetical protein
MNLGGCARHKVQRERGHCCFMHGGCLFPWKSGRDGVFGDVLVTLWYALVMCWVGSSMIEVVIVDVNGEADVGMHDFEGAIHL